MAIILGLILLAAHLLPLIHAQCTVINGPVFYDWVQGTCNSDPTRSARLAIPLALGTRWDDNLLVNAVVSYSDTNDVGHRVTGFPQAVWNSNADNTITMSFPVALSDIPHGSVVRQTVLVTGTRSGCTWAGRASYTQNHFPTMTSEAYTTIITVMEATSTTTTSTLEEVFTTTETPPTVTATSVTGYKTVWAKRVTTTKTSTITPKPITQWSLSVTKTTTTVTCIPEHRKRDATLPGRRAGAVGVQQDVELGRRQDVAYELPYCSAVTTTTIYTDTIIIPITNTITDTLTAYATTTTTTTTTAPTPTSYTSVRGTTTLTPTCTRTRWSILPPVRTTKVKVITVTVTKFPGGKWPKKCTSTKGGNDNPRGPVCTLGIGL
ncbi:hypothetical protein P154DRAFT_536095 [Amniculicola lignicola CBS 123094]|uniref:Lytic polysaccharide monooxygenase n=1 Tax=Amniculicola lignicola CBS 123094 TaxID=1392246 RepID=A0A6A5WA57_9PLEO|nr:hypothetical protein P154DRAFT_536095 [Amniculicola lignicola CBS 123094]